MDEEAIYDENARFKRVFKYFIQFMIVALSLYYLPEQPMDKKKIFCIATISAATFAILDMYYPLIYRG